MAHSDICASSLLRPGSCSCPETLAAGTIDNNIWKLRSIFRENGRGSLWNDDLHLGNPVAHPSVRQYQAMVLEEQTIARTLPAQATPFSLDKLKLVCSHLHQLAIAPSTSQATDISLREIWPFLLLSFSQKTEEAIWEG